MSDFDLPARARVNDLPVDPRAPALSIFDRGLLYGDGVFEVLRTYRGRPFALEDHLARMNLAATSLGIPMGVPNARWIAQVDELLGECTWPESVVRLTLTRGVGAPGVAPPRDCTPTRIIAVYPLPALGPIESRAVSAVTIRGPEATRSGPSAGRKTLEYLTSVMALRHAHALGAEEAIFLDARGRVVEAASANVFVREGSTIRTPPENEGSLPGITARFACEAARAEGFEVQRAPLREADLWTADEIFLTSSVREIVPVIRVDEHEVADAQVGEGTRRLYARFRALVGA